ncbi:MAG TPA: hypothetical protein VNV86_01805 [Candidatus Acidoferrum sp.]|nr:hypothetical protein [Candidatus Acidoferrum sp.]
MRTRSPAYRAWSRLGELSGRLPDAVMRKLNFAVDGEHRPPAQVAERFLNSAFR